MDWDLFSDTIVSAVRDHVERATAPLIDQIEALRAENTKIAAALAPLAPRLDDVERASEALRDIDINVSERVAELASLHENQAIQVAQQAADLNELSRNAGELQSALDAIPEGKNGLDGVGFDDMAAEYDGERTITLRFERGENVKTFSFDMPIVLDRGVWKDGEYKAGDGVTWAGSFWIARKGTESKPGSGDAWRLAVKRGQDGKKP